MRKLFQKLWQLHWFQQSLLQQLPSSNLHWLHKPISRQCWQWWQLHGKWSKCWPYQWRLHHLCWYKWSNVFQWTIQCCSSEVISDGWLGTRRSQWKFNRNPRIINSDGIAEKIMDPRNNWNRDSGQWLIPIGWVRDINVSMISFPHWLTLAIHATYWEPMDWLSINFLNWQNAGFQHQDPC